MKIGRGRRWKN